DRLARNDGIAAHLHALALATARLTARTPGRARRGVALLARIDDAVAARRQRRGRGCRRTGRGLRVAYEDEAVDILPRRLGAGDGLRLDPHRPLLLSVLLQAHSGREGVAPGVERERPSDQPLPLRAGLLEGGRRARGVALVQADVELERALVVSDPVPIAGVALVADDFPPILGARQAAELDQALVGLRVHTWHDGEERRSEDENQSEKTADLHGASPTTVLGTHDARQYMRNVPRKLSGIGNPGPAAMKPVT